MHTGPDLSELDVAIQRLKTVLNDPVCRANMTLSTVTGFLGELIVRQRLKKEGIEVSHHGKMSSYDLEYGPYKIDVKTSARKSELGEGLSNWGWALKRESKRKNACTHFVCLALDERYEPVAYYVLHASHARDLSSGVGQFSKVQAALMVVSGQRMPSPTSKWHESVAVSRELIERGAVVVADAGHSLIEAIERA